MNTPETKHPETNADSRDGTIAHLEKRLYRSPTLRLYGSVKSLTRGTASVGNDAGFGNQRMNRRSDPRLKENVVLIGQHPRGFGLYLFDYKDEYRDRWGHGRQFGVMADEVEQVFPKAVSVHPDGFKMVDYGMLGISCPMH